MKKYEVIHKEVGETPLEALERYRSVHTDLLDVPMTYAGRLDPMAEGQLLILIGDECKNKEKYLGLDKEYEVEIVFGISTDTYDALGIPVLNDSKLYSADQSVLNLYVGKLKQEYPPYSSKTVNGKQMHEWARAGELPDRMPTKDVEIYSINLLDQKDTSREELKQRIIKMIGKVRGDFRQSEIIHKWQSLQGPGKYQMIRIRVKCSAGTYMRSLANKIGSDNGSRTFCLSIVRTKIFL